ncbi:MAG: hypothetical protein M3Z24_08090 [Chloroflexota bacterium]|nr:hypothetical protein [Chloroflexota bacterium]
MENSPPRQTQPGKALILREVTKEQFSIPLDQNLVRTTPQYDTTKPICLTRQAWPVFYPGATTVGPQA